MYIFLAYVGLIGVGVGGICWRIYRLEKRVIDQLARREAHLTAIRLKTQKLKPAKPHDFDLPWSLNPLFNDG